MFLLLVRKELLSNLKTFRLAVACARREKRLMR
jgi:hypothetical protein